MTQKINLSFMHVISGVLFLVMIFFQMTRYAGGFRTDGSRCHYLLSLDFWLWKRAEDLQRAEPQRQSRPFTWRRQLLVIVCMIFQ